MALSVGTISLPGSTAGVEAQLTVATYVRERRASCFNFFHCGELLLPELFDMVINIGHEIDIRAIYYAPVIILLEWMDKDPWFPYQ